MISLRPYQAEAVQSIYDYYLQGNTGNCLVVLPTGAGKSLTMAAFIKRAIDDYANTRILLLTHVKELIEQDARAIIRYWPECPIGIYSASVGQKVKAQVTVAGIQSVHRVPAKFGGTNLVLIDEAHLVPRSSETMYGRFLAGLLHHNPRTKVIGFTATHYRMDSGLLIEGDKRIFDAVTYEAGVGDLIKQGYLCPLVAKNGATKADLSGVHVRGGEYVAGELQAAMDKDDLIEGALDEVAKYASNREHVLGFCAGVSHAMHCAEAARRRGWTADYVSGDMSMDEREAKIARFTSGRVRFLFNAVLLSTGFDYPSIDCILMLRPTKSTGLYCQILGRGLRHDGKKENTLVLDFAGNIERHGPIDRIQVKSKRAKGEDAVSVAPVKECPQCHELVHASIMLCPECNHEWEQKAPHGVVAAEAVIVASVEPPKTYAVTNVEYRAHAKAGRPMSLRVTYECGLAFFNEWIPIEDPRAGVRKWAIKWCWDRGVTCPDTVEEFLEMAKEGRVPAPASITVRPDGKWWKVVGASFNWKQQGAA